MSGSVRRVLIIHDYCGLRGGAEIVIDDLRGGLESRGVEVQLLTSTADPCAEARPPDRSFHGTTGASRALTETANPFAARTLRQLLISFDPDVVHVGMFLTQASPLILPLLRDRSVVWMPNEYRPVCPKGTRLLPNGDTCTFEVGRACLDHGCFRLRGWVPRMIQHSLLQRWRGVFDRVVAPSRAFARILEQHGWRVDVVVPHGVPLAEEPKRWASAPTVGYVGRLVPEKGVHILVDAFSAVSSHYEDATLWIIGDGPQRSELESQVRRLGLTAQVEFHGHIPRDEVQRRMAQAWLQCVPSVWPEPFGLVTAEGMGRGTAVIGSEHGAQPELIEEGRTGFLVPAGDPHTLGSAIVQALANPDRLEEMGDEARRRAVRMLSVDAMTHRLLEVYGELAGGGPATRVEDRPRGI